MRSAVGVGVAELVKDLDRLKKLHEQRRSNQT